METIYHKILPMQVFLPYIPVEPSEADRWMGHLPNKWGNRSSGNDFIDLFAGLVRIYAHRPPFFYAQLMGIQSSQLCVTLTTLTGLKVTDWIDYFVLMASDELLQSGCPPMQFYKKLGFTSVANFSVCYKRLKGMRPTHWAGMRRKFR